MKKTLLFILFISCAVGINNSAIAEHSSCLLLGPNPSFIVKIKGFYSSLTEKSNLAYPQLTILSDVAKLNFTSAKAMSNGQYILAFTPQKKNQVCYQKKWLADVQQKLLNEKLVTRISPNILMSTQSVAVPTPSAKQWDLSSNTAQGGIDMPTAWAITTGNEHAIVAVLDNGIQTNASLAPNLLSSDAVSFHNGNIADTGAESQCPTCSSAYHGTHVSGTVASTGNGSYGEYVYGVAYTGRVLPVNVFTKFTGSTCTNSGASSPCSLAYNSDIENALSWLNGTTFPGLLVAPHVVAVNLSLGSKSSCSSSEQDDFNKLIQKNISIVTAAGNKNEDSTTFSPGNCEDVINVAATGSTNLKASYSNWGAAVNIAAPGGDSSLGQGLIYSTILDGYDELQGTSMAAPHVAGLVSLMYSVDPSLTPAQVLSDLQSHATTPNSGNYPYSCSGIYTCGAGIINAGSTISAIELSKPTLQWTPNFQVTQLSSNNFEINWTAATWSNASPVSIAYTVKLEGVTEAECENISATSCTLQTDNINTATDINFTVEATDGRQILTPVEQTGTIEEGFDPPTLTSAERLLSDPTQAYVHYSDLGAVFTSYKVLGYPNATVTVDAANNRFLIQNLNDMEQLTLKIVGVTANSEEIESNAVTLPPLEPLAPILTKAERNPMQLNQAWVYVGSSVSIFPGDEFSATNLPGSEITYQSDKNRFFIRDISSARATNFHITIRNKFDNTANSNDITLPGIN